MLVKKTSPFTIKSPSKKKRKILMIHCEYKQLGGESSAVFEEIKLLRKGGNAVSLVQFSNTKNTLWKFFLFPFNVSSYIKTIKKIKDFKPDVVHVHNLHFAASNAIVYAVKKMRIPLVVTLHNFRLLCPSATLFFNGKLFLKSLNETFSFSAVKKGVYQNSRLLTFWLEFSTWLHQKMGTYQLVDKYIVLSQHANRLFENSRLKLKKEQLIIKPNFVAPPKKFSSSRGNHILFVGRLSEEKGVDLLLKVFSESSYELRIAGEGSYKESVLKYCKEFSNIKYLGLLNKDEVYSEMQSCSALVFPSIWYEGMPLTIIESFACKTPVIASDIGAMAAMIKNEYNGLHFDPKKTEDLKLKLQQWFCLDKSEKEEYYNNAYQTYQRLYTPEKNAEQLLSIYDSVIPLQYKLSVV